MLIDCNEKLQEIAKKLQNCSFIAMDTEFLLHKTYYPKLCLLQIATEQNCFLIDPFLTDLKILNPIFIDSKIIKIFHAPQKDLEILERVCQVEIQGIFDTQIASMLCLYDTNFPSYQALVLRFLEKKIDKKQQMTNWAKRPLTTEQINYAKNDVIFLLQIYNKLLNLIKKQDKLEIMRSLMMRESFAKTQINIEKIWQKLCNEQNISYHSFFQEMIEWREQKAQENNLCRGLIFHDQDLLRFAEIMEKPEKIDGILKKNKKFRREILKKINNFKNNDKKLHIVRKSNNKHSKNYDTRVIQIFELLTDFLCQKESIARAIVANRKNIIDFIYHQKGPLHQGWIYERFGKKIQDLIDKKRGIYFENNMPVLSDIKLD